MDFLCGWTLQEMVCPSSTLTQRTMYDWHKTCQSVNHSPAPAPSRRDALTHLAVNLELLDARHDAVRSTRPDSSWRERKAN